jgi:hypothetical protein
LVSGSESGAAGQHGIESIKFATRMLIGTAYHLLAGWRSVDTLPFTSTLYADPKNAFLILQYD